MLAALPLLAICGAMIAMVVSKASTTGQEAYNVAGAIVEQSVGAIRTVRQRGVGTCHLGGREGGGHGQRAMLKCMGQCLSDSGRACCCTRCR